MDKITDDLLAACEDAVSWLEGWASAEPYICRLRAAIAAYDTAKAAQEQPVEDHFDTMVVKTAPAKSHREILAEEYERIFSMCNNGDIPKWIRTGERNPIIPPYVALAAMARVAAPAPDLLAASMKAANELRQAARALAKAGDHEAAAVADIAEERTRAAIAKATGAA